MHQNVSIPALSSIEIILAHMSTGAALYDAQELKLLSANQAFFTINSCTLKLSYTPEQIVQKPLNQWLPERYARFFTLMLQKVIETGIPLRQQAVFADDDNGQLTYLEYLLTPIKNAGSHVVFIVNDVTAQVMEREQFERTHRALLQATERIESEHKRLSLIEEIAQCVKGPLNLVDIGNVVARTLYANLHPCYVSMYMSDHAQRTLHNLGICPLPDTDDSWQLIKSVPYDSGAIIAHAYKSHEPTVIEDLQELQDGTERAQQLIQRGYRGYVCVPLWFKDAFEGTLSAAFHTPIHTDSLEVQIFIGASKHIVAALAHARLLREVEHKRKRLHTILDQLPEGVLIVNALDATISYVNEAAITILRQPATHFINARLVRLFSFECDEVTYKDGQPLIPNGLAIIRALRGETLSGKETLVRVHGAMLALRSSAAPIRDERGVIVGAVMIFQDITAYKSIEQQKHEFLELTSNELRSPITAIQGLAEILHMHITRGYQLSTLRSQHAITAIIEYSQQLTRLIEELLDLACLEKAQLVLNTTLCDLHALLKHVIDVQKLTAKQHYFSIVCEGIQPQQPIWVNCDEKRIVQILTNLLNNAIKYSPEASEIEVGIRYRCEQPTEVLLWVKDHGTGISAHELPFVFKRFHRSSTLAFSHATGHAISGLGISLYLVNEFVKRHGGRVWVESREQCGSTFYVLLPTQDASQDHAHAGGKA